MVIALTPRLAFLKDKPLAASHADIAASPSFHRAIGTALLEYQLSLTSTTEPASLAATGLRLQGAKDFVRVLLNLSEPEAPEADRTPPGLVPPENVPVFKWPESPKP